LVVLLVGLYFGVDPAQLSALLGGGDAASGGSSPGGPPADDAQSRFVRVVLADTEETWNDLFRSAGRRYAEPVLVLFSGQVQSACGFQSAAVGPFYCPADRKAYLDLQFFADLERRFGAPGDFARAYVVAHEIGHHIQNLLGTSGEVHRKRRALPKAEANQLSVRLELQADCYAGVWGHHAHKKRGLLEPGDLEEGLRAAAAIGDDTLQKRGGGRVQPESWTHGSSAQRVEWFTRGFESGRMDACDTFGG
jgi:predicted metalloprotease